MDKKILVGKELGTIIWRILLDGFRPFFFYSGRTHQPAPHIPMQSHLAHTKKGECGHFWLTNGIVRALIESSYVDPHSIFITSQLLIARMKANNCTGSQTKDPDPLLPCWWCDDVGLALVI